MATRKRIQAYVNDATYAQIEGYAHREGLSISEAAGQLLSTHLVDSAQSSTSDYVTRHEMEVMLARLEARYQSICESLHLHSLELFGEMLKVERSLKPSSPNKKRKR